MAQDRRKEFPHILRANGEVYSLVVPEPFVSQNFEGSLREVKSIEEAEQLGAEAAERTIERQNQ